MNCWNEAALLNRLPKSTDFFLTNWPAEIRMLVFRQWYYGDDDIDVGDGCWGQNVSVTTLKYWLPTYFIEMVTIITKKKLTLKLCCQHLQTVICPLSFNIGVRHQYSKYVTNIHTSSRTLSHKHHCHPYYMGQISSSYIFSPNIGL